MENEQNQDYVLVHKSQAKISRARKGLIGFMVVGAIAAISGAGTFASFSASTTNDATFRTARLALENGGDTGCVTPAGQSGTGVANSDIDTNEAESDGNASDFGVDDCPSLFDEPIIPGVLETASVEIQNVGDVTGDLYLFTEDACDFEAASASFDMGDETDICDRVLISIERDSDDECIFPNTVGACAALTNTAASNSFNDFDAADFDAKITAIEDLAENATETFTVNVRMIRSEGAGCAAGDDTGTVDGFVDTTGIGCDNGYINQAAILNLKWLMQAAA